MHSSRCHKGKLVEMCCFDPNESSNGPDDFVRFKATDPNFSLFTMQLWALSRIRYNIWDLWA